MAGASELDHAFSLLRKLKKSRLPGSVESKLKDFAEKHPSDRFASLIESNLDLLIENQLKGVNAAQILVQLVLELDGEDVFREKFLAGASQLELGPVYYCDPGSAFLKSSDCRILNGHEGGVCSHLNLGDGRFVSGDEEGGVVLWESLVPVQNKKLEGHRGPIVKIHDLGEKGILSVCHEGTLRLWDRNSGELLYEMDAGTPVIGVEVFGGNIAVFHSVTETGTEMLHGVHEIEVQKRISLRAFDISTTEWAWEREFDVPGSSSLLALADGRAFLRKGSWLGDLGTFRCPCASIIDPADGSLDSTFEWFVQNCSHVLYSSSEMPLIHREVNGRSELIRHDGSRIEMTELLNRRICESSYILAVGDLGFLCDRAMEHTFLKILSGSVQTYPVNEGSMTHRERFLSGSRNTFGEENWFYVFDLVSGEELFCQSYPSEEQPSACFPCDELLLVLFPGRVLWAVDLVTGTRTAFRDTSSLSEYCMYFPELLPHGRILLRGAGSKLCCFDLDQTGEQPFSQKYRSFDWVPLGARDNLLFLVDSRNDLVVYDADTCRETMALGRFPGGVEGMVCVEDGHFGAWSSEQGFFSWDVNTGEQLSSYRMPGYELTGVLVLTDGKLLCWGNIWGEDSFESDELRVAEYDWRTGSEKELFKLGSSVDPTTGLMQFIQYNAIAGQCLELSDGRILIPPHSTVRYNKRRAFDIVCMERERPDKFSMIPLDGYTPGCIQELPGGILLICSKNRAHDELKAVSRVFFRNSVAGELLYASPELEHIGREAVFLEEGLIGVFGDYNEVSVFRYGDRIEYIGDKHLTDIFKNYPGCFDRGRKAVEIRRSGNLLRTPMGACSHDYRWSCFWGNFLNEAFVEVSDNMLAVGRGEAVTCAAVRSSLENAWLFRNSIAVLSRDERLGFMRKWEGGTEE